MANTIIQTAQAGKIDESYGKCLDSKWKLGFHPDRINALIENRLDEIAPITVHFAPTLRCNHDCYFCTYGCAKKGREKTQMTLAEAEKYLEELHDIGVKGVIFTGGGDPCMHKDLYQMCLKCYELGLHFSLNTNGLGLNAELSKKILELNPVYIRMSINSGSREVQKLMAGVDDFEIVMNNYEMLLRNKIETGSDSSISVAYVVGIANYTDVEVLADRLYEIEKRLEDNYHIKPQVNFTVRPIYNYEGSKSFNKKIMSAISDYLAARSSGDEKLFHSFMYDGVQTPQYILDNALKIIKDTKERLVRKGSAITVCFPEIKFEMLDTVQRKPYKQCFGLHYYGFVWPDGRLFPCVEKAGTDGCEIGSLKTSSAREILKSKQKSDVISGINANIHTHCPAICAYHEVNSYLSDIKNDLISYIPENLNKYDNLPREIDFI